MDQTQRRDIDSLYEAILRLRTVAECRSFFRDLLTEHEIGELAERWRVAQMLTQGCSYAEIEKETGASSRTIARVSKWLKEGAGGYRLIMRRLEREE